jgi:hypothetical protein
MIPVHASLTRKHHFGSRGTIKKLSKHYIHDKPIAIRSNSLICYKSYTSVGCSMAYLESEDSNAEESRQQEAHSDRKNCAVRLEKDGNAGGRERLRSRSDASLARPDVCHRTSAHRTRGRAGSERAPFRRSPRHRADYEGVLQDEFTRPKGVRDCAGGSKVRFRILLGRGTHSGLQRRSETEWQRRSCAHPSQLPPLLDSSP